MSSNWIKNAQNAHVEAQKLEILDKENQEREKKLKDEAVASFLTSNVSFIYPGLEQIVWELSQSGYESSLGYHWNPVSTRTRRLLKPTFTSRGHEDGSDMHFWIEEHYLLVFGTGICTGNTRHELLEIVVGLDKKDNFQLELELCEWADEDRLDRKMWMPRKVSRLLVSDLGASGTDRILYSIRDTIFQLISRGLYKPQK